MQRLAILSRNHRDEQYLARRNLRDLPDTIKRLTRRMEGLTADMATIAAHDEPLPSTESLGMRLNRVPAGVHEMRFPMGKYRGLEFGMILHPLGGSEVYLEGNVTRRTTILRDNHGPRAVLNAMERLADGYAGEREGVRQDLVVAEGQLRDYEGRIGAPFAHSEYQRQLADDLRDALKLGLSEKAPEGGMPVAELAERIKTLRAENAVEAAPVRAGGRKAVAGEVPVTSRIRRRAEAVEEVKSEPEVPPLAAVEIAMPEPVASEVKPVESYEQRVTRRRHESQMKLF